MIFFNNLPQRNGQGLFDLSDDEDAMEGSYAVERAESFEDEGLVVLHGAGVDFQLIVIVTGGVEAFYDLVDFHDYRGELAGVFLAVVLQTDIAEDHYAVPCLDGIDDGDVFPDVSFSFEAFLALEDGRRGQVDLGGQFFGCEFGVPLQLTQN